MNSRRIWSGPGLSTRDIFFAKLCATKTAQSPMCAATTSLLNKVYPATCRSYGRQDLVSFKNATSNLRRKSWTLVLQSFVFTEFTFHVTTCNRYMLPWVRNTTASTNRPPRNMALFLRSNSFLCLSCQWSPCLTFRQECLLPLPQSPPFISYGGMGTLLDIHTFFLAS